MQKVFRFLGCVNALGALGLLAAAAIDPYGVPLTPVMFLICAVAASLGSVMCFWFARFIDRLEAVEGRAHGAAADGGPGADRAWFGVYAGWIILVSIACICCLFLIGSLFGTVGGSWPLWLGGFLLGVGAVAFYSRFMLKAQG